MSSAVLDIAFIGWTKHQYINGLVNTQVCIYSGMFMKEKKSVVWRRKVNTLTYVVKVSIGCDQNLNFIRRINIKRRKVR